MTTPAMLAHGENLPAAMTTWFCWGSASVICLCLAIGLYLTDGTKKKQLYAIGILWLVIVVLSPILAIRMFR